MPNPALTEKIRNLPPLLDSLERDAEVSDLLRRSDAARERFRQMFPLDGVEQSALEDYRKEWMARYVYNSNAIEGSTLTLEDTELVLEGEFVPSDSPARYVFAARGVADGMAYVREYAKEGRKLNEELIRRLHEVTALDLQPFARGTFRPYGYWRGSPPPESSRGPAGDSVTTCKSWSTCLNGSGAHPLLKAPDSMRCSRTSIRSWTATGGPAASCSTSCCCGTDTVPWPSNTMRVGHTRAAWRHGRWMASRIRSAPFS